MKLKKHKDKKTTNSLADDDVMKTSPYYQQKNIITTELLNSFNASGVPKHC